MKKYIRVCLSLDEETRKLMNEITEISGTSNSKVIKHAIKHFYKAIIRSLK